MTQIPALVLLLCLSLLSFSVQTKAQIDPQAQTYTADATCFSGQDFCLTGIYSAQDQTINYTMIVKGSFAGWRAVGQGQSMNGANMLISWIYDNVPVLSHRSAGGKSLPREALATGSFTPDQDVIRATSDMTVISWNFPQTTSPGNAMPHIWAANTVKAPSAGTSSSSFSIHDNYGEFTMDFTKAYSGEAPAVPSGVAALSGWDGSATTDASTSTVSSSGSSTGSSMTDNRAADYRGNRVWIAHMTFMLIGWLVLVPAGIMVARFGRLAYTWFPAHRTLQLLALLFVLIGFLLAVGVMQHMGWSHFTDKHHQMGLAATILLFVQALFGQATHVYRVKTVAAGLKPTRFLGIAHAVFGLVTFSLAIATIHTGLLAWKWWNPPSSASIPVYVWVGVLGAIYIGGVVLILPKQLRKERDEGELEKIESS